MVRGSSPYLGSPRSVGRRSHRSPRTGQRNVVHYPNGCDVLGKVIETLMRSEDFERKMRRADTLSRLTDQPDYYVGYIRGLHRLRHGERFDTEDEHQQWLALASDVDKRRRERGRGYRDGLAGRDPQQDDVAGN